MKYLVFLTLAYLLVGCSEPKSYLDDAIEDQGFIPHTSPIEDFRVGTILSGTHDQPQLIAEAKDCLPDDKFRVLKAISLANKYENLSFDAGLNRAIGAGNNVINFNLNASYVKSVSIEFEGASIELLHTKNFEEYFKTLNEEDTCKNYLLSNAFINKSLRIDKMKFVFFDKGGVAINIGSKLDELANLGPGVNFDIERGYELIIETPKHIGYTMGKYVIKEGGRSVVLNASTLNSKSEWEFRDLSVLSILESFSFTESSLDNLPLAEPLN